MAPTDKTTSTGTKLAVGGAALALFGGLLAALSGGSKKPATPKLSGSGKGCGPCGR
jgi:hypothetical protein